MSRVEYYAYVCDNCGKPCGKSEPLQGMNRDFCDSFCRDQYLRLIPREIISGKPTYNHPREPRANEPEFDV